MKTKLLIIILLTTIISLTVGSKNKPCVNCNIMLIDIDILRADALPCFGYSRNTAPNICALAKKSVLFKDNYSTATWTLPSIFSTITSLYPTFHGVRTMYLNKLSSDIPTLAEILKEQGYQTVYIGDYNDSVLMTQRNGGLRGYDVITTDTIEKVLADLSKTSKPWFIHYYNSDLHLPYLISENEKTIEEMVAPKGLPIRYGGFEQLLNGYLKKHYAAIFNKKAINKYRLTILAPDKHQDVSVTKLFFELGNTNQEEYLIDSWKPIYETYMNSFDQKKPSDAAYVRMMYDTNIKILDKKLEALLQELDSEPLVSKTITVLMSDHGEAFGEHGTFTHGNGYHTELFQTPLIIRSPQLAAKIVEGPTGNMDIFPTLLELVGIDKVEGLQGQSLVSNIDPGRFVLSEIGFGGFNGVVLQNKNWLYFLPEGSSMVDQSILYNKIVDPNEKENVATKYPELIQSLYRKANLLRSYETKVIPNFDEIKLDPEKVKRLQKEGYF